MSPSPSAAVLGDRGHRGEAVRVQTDVTQSTDAPASVANGPVDHNGQPDGGLSSGPPASLPGEPRGVFKLAPFTQAMGTYLPATVLFRLINFGRILVLTYFMTRQQFGLLNMILLVVNVLTPLCSLGLNEAVTRYVPQHEHQGSLQQFLRSSLTLLLGISAVGVALLLAASGVLGGFFYAQVTDTEVMREFRADAPEIARITAVVIGLLILYFYLLAVMKGLRMFTALAQMELIHALLFLGGALVAISTGHLSAVTLASVYGISLLVPIVFFGFGLFMSVGRWQAQAAPLISTNLTQKLLRFSVWTTVAGVTWQVLVYYPVWFLNKIHGHEAVAVFSAVRQIGQFILVGAVAVVTVVMTTVTKTWESRGRAAAEQQLSLAFRGTGLGLLFLCAAIALGRNWIIRLFADEYAPGAVILPLHLLFFLCGAFLAFLPIHFHLIEKTRHLIWPWAIGVAGNVLYAIWLVKPQRLAQLQSLDVYQQLSEVTTRVFTTGFAGMQGLSSAAWCGVFAIFTALVTCVLLIRVECNRLDRGSYIIMAASLLLAAQDAILPGGMLVLIAVAFERRRVTGYVVGAIRHIPPFGWVRNKFKSQ